MPKRLFLWTATVLALVCARGAAAECRLGRIAELPFQVVRGKLLVHGKVNDQDATFVFDTGSATTFMTKSAVAHLNLRAARDEGHGTGNLMQATGIGGSTSGYAVQARSVDLGGLRARNFGFFAINREFGFTDPPPDGLLSADLLAKYDIDLDFASQRVRLFYPQGDCSHPSVYLHGNLFEVPMLPGSRDHSPRIEVSVGNQTLTAMIDTGSSGVVLNAATAQRIGIAPLQGSKSVRVGGVGESTVEAHRAMLPSLGVGDLEFQNVHAVIAEIGITALDRPVDMLLGLSFLAKVHAWISYSSQTLVIQFPPAPSPAN
jgi:clan AA aspartic protease (TIGR02281 family)